MAKLAGACRFVWNDARSWLGVFNAAVAEFTDICRNIRRQGSAALDLAYVASGRLDGFWEMGLAAWDIATGALIVKEAGGFVADLEDGERHFETGDIVAANPRCFKLMVACLRRHLATAA